MPKTGPLALKGYVTGFFYLAAWGPLFVILHMMLMFKGAADMSGRAGSGGLTLASFTGIADVNSDIGILAGYLIASVPFLAGGIAKGAMAISRQATSYLDPARMRQRKPRGRPAPAMSRSATAASKIQA